MAVILGSEVKDQHTELTGIAVGRTEFLYGCAQVAIDPGIVKDGEPVAPSWFDEQRVVVRKAAAPAAHQNAIPLGAEVKDTLTGLKGLVVGRLTNLHATPEIQVDLLEIKDGRPLPASWMHERRFKVTKAPKPLKVSPASSARSGGPPDAPSLTPRV